MKQPRKRRTSEEMFLDKLADISKGEQTLIPNITLRESLGWDEEKYHRIRLALKKEGRINVGQGQGGKVGLSAAPNSQSLKMFISYCHADEDFKKDFLNHINPLKRLKLIDSWHDGMISAGKDIDASVKSALNAADIIVMLVSIDYLNSYYCVEIEMERAMERHDAGEARIVPIVLRSCMWQYMPFQKLKALPKDAKAVATWPDRDSAFASVAEDLRLTAEDLLSNH